MADHGGGDVDRFRIATNRGRVSDGEWHTVIVKRDGRNVSHTTGAGTGAGAGVPRAGVPGTGVQRPGVRTPAPPLVEDSQIPSPALFRNRVYLWPCGLYLEIKKKKSRMDIPL